ncbi:MAG TPA: hypothetical protein VL523_17070 [Terriglobia bacterium]|nr:hypothetical protein [Terriglobia bacterium]
MAIGLKTAGVHHIALRSTNLEQAARTAGVVVRVFSVAVGSTVGNSTAVSKLRRSFLSNG